MESYCTNDGFKFRYCLQYVSSAEQVKKEFSNITNDSFSDSCTIASLHTVCNTKRDICSDSYTITSCALWVVKNTRQKGIENTNKIVSRPLNSYESWNWSSNYAESGRRTGEEGAVWGSSRGIWIVEQAYGKNAAKCFAWMSIEYCI